MKRSKIGSRSMTSAISVLAWMTILPGCATMMGKKSTNHKVAIDSDPVVQQSGAESPAISRLNRDQWVSIRNHSKDAYTRLYADLGAGEWDAASIEARNFLQKNPRDYVALNVLATSLAMQKNYTLAAFYGSVIDQYYPGNSDSDNLRGLATLFKTGANMEDFRKAEKFFQKSFDSDNQQIAAGMNLGRLYLDLGKSSAARETFAKVRERCHDCLESMIGYGIAQSRSRDYEGAKQTFLAVIGKDPKNTKAMYRLALIEQTGYNNSKDAVKYLERILADNTDREKDLKRRANFMLRKIQAAEYGSPVEQVAHERSKKDDKSHVNPEELMNASDGDED